MFSMYKRTIPFVLLFVAGGISAQAQQTCSNSTLTGTYYYLANGSVISGSQILPFAELSQFIFDGKGGVTGQAATNDNGVFASFSFAGMYSVQASCKGGLTLSANPPAAGPFDFQILNGGQERFDGLFGLGRGDCGPRVPGNYRDGAMWEGIVHRQLRFSIHGNSRRPAALGGRPDGFRRRRESEREQRAGY